MKSRPVRTWPGPEDTLVVGHLVANYLPLTENWIHTLATSAPHVTTVVLNRGRALDLDRYPVESACHLDTLTPSQCRDEADGWERRHLSVHLRHACLDFKCRVLHAHFGTEGVLHAGLARYLGIPLVTSFYGYDVGALPRDPRWAPGLETLFASGTLFLAEGPFMAGSLASLGCPADRIRIVPLPVDGCRSLSANHRERADPVVLICGRLVEKKGVDDSVRALALLRAKHPRLRFRTVIVGDGPERTRIERIVVERGLTDIVSMPGSMPPESLKPILATARVVLQMSRTASDGDCEGGAPVVLAEAQALGVPVVATRHCDIPATVVDLESGLLVDSGDIEGAAHRLARLIGDPAVAARMGAHGRRRMARERSREVCGRQLRRCYEEAITLADRRRFEPAVFVRASLGLIIDLRRVAGDLDGLTRLEAKIVPGDPERGALLRAIADVQRREGRPLDAAATLRRWSREYPDETYGPLEEAECLLEGGAVEPAIAPFAQFITAHPDTDYAVARVAGVLRAAEADPGLLLRIVRQALPAVEVFLAVASHLRAFPTTSLSPASRCRLRNFIARVVEHDLRALTGTPRRRSRSAGARLETAVADLLVLASDLGSRHAFDRVDLVFPLSQLRHALPMYRVASLLERGSAPQRALAKRLFARVARCGSATADLRSGACFHLARIASDEHHREAGLAFVRRCLEHDAGHAGARRLWSELRPTDVAPGERTV